MSKLITLNTLKVRSSKYISNQYLQDARLEVLDELDGIVMHLTAEVLDYLHTSNITIERDYYNTITAPRFANPWEHLKARYAGRSWFRWYVKRYPVKYVNEIYNVSIHANYNVAEHLTFPDSQLRFPSKLGHPVQVIAVTSEDAIWNGSVDNPLS
jgi:hypothetical protein